MTTENGDVIRVALFDIDGVLTDGMIYVDAEGNETKRISFDDIDAIFELKRAGLRVGFITGENSRFSEYVRKRFLPDYFAGGCKDKLSYFKKLEEEQGLDKNSTCFVGDSQKDTGLLDYVAYSFVPSDVDCVIWKYAKYVTKAERGKGVIREVVRFILGNRSGTDHGGDEYRPGIAEHSRVVRLLDEPAFFVQLRKAIEVIVRALKQGNKLLICGNGGSAADSQHVATELVSSFMLERKALDAEALTVNTSCLTAIGNDSAFENVFSRQLEAKGRPGDVLLALSTSGNSPNILKVLATAKHMKITTVGLTGSNRESGICGLADYCMCIPSTSIPRIQEAHILIGHIICEAIEKRLFGKNGG